MGLLKTLLAILLWPLSAVICPAEDHDVEIPDWLFWTGAGLVALAFVALAVWLAVTGGRGDVSAVSAAAASGG